jgi:hypothetical protein
VRFRRKGNDDSADEGVGDGRDHAAEVAEAAARALADGPLDADDIPHDHVERVDLGSLLVAPEQGRELRLQVDEASGTVQAVIIAGAEGAVELRAFAAPRNGDLWAEARPQIAAEVAQSGGTATERQGPWGTELICQVGQRGGQQQLTRIVGINGPRWMLRASLLGKPAVDPDGSPEWEDSIRRVAVQRGTHALPVGEPLPVTMPPQARRVEPPTGG